MASYIPPTADLSTFNPAIFNQGDSEGITLQEADSRYLKKSGGFLTGGLGAPSNSLNGEDLVGLTQAQATAIADNTEKVGITSAQATAIADNTENTGITSAHATAIADNTEKTGITTAQATEITSFREQF